MTSFKRKVISASKWSALAEISTKAITPLIFVILARLLSPADYGVVAAATLVIGFSQIFTDAGLTNTLIQSQEDKFKVANIVFWTNITLSVLIYFVIFVFSDIIASSFKDANISIVLKVQSLIIIINSLSSVQSALLKKELDFRKLFFVRLFTVAAPGLASIPLAYFGFGYWALVAGTLVGSVIQVFALWFSSNWRPTISLDFTLAKKLYKFSIVVTMESFLAWFYNWGDSTIVGIYLSTKELGLFRTGNSFVVMVFGFILSPLLPVLYSAFSKINTNAEKLKRAYLEVQKFVSFITLPITFVLFFFSFQIEFYLFGKHWEGIGLVIQIFGLVYGLSWIFGTTVNPELYRAIGKPKINFMLMISTLPLYAVVYFFSVKHGLIFFLIARSVLSLLTFPIHLFLSKKIIGINIYDNVKNIKTIGLIILSFSFIMVINNIMGIIDVNDLFGNLTILITFFSSILIFEKRYIFNTMNTILAKEKV